MARKIIKRAVKKAIKKKVQGLRPDGSFYWRKGNWMLYLNKKKTQQAIKAIKKIKRIIKK